jgi:hypothetical protein
MKSLIPLTALALAVSCKPAAAEVIETVNDGYHVIVVTGDDMVCVDALEEYDRNWYVLADEVGLPNVSLIGDVNDPITGEPLQVVMLMTEDGSRSLTYGYYYLTGKVCLIGSVALTEGDDL